MALNFSNNGSNSNNNNNNSGNNNPLFNPFISTPQDNDDFDVESLTVNYNEKFKNKTKCLFRDEVIKQTLSTLIGKNKPNAILVGLAGVGKTEIVETIASMIENDNPLIPPSLLDSTIYELNLTSLISDTSYRGQMEKKLNDLLTFLSDENNKAILFIDEIHRLVSRNQVYTEVAQTIKPYLARGDIKVIGATTTQESKNLMEDPAFSRRFSKIIVDELTQEQTLEIIKTLKPQFESFHNNKVLLDDKTLEAIVNISDKYKSKSQHRPDVAITLLDKAMSESIVDRLEKEQKAVEQNNQLVINAFKQNPQIILSDEQIENTAKKALKGNSKIKKTNFKELEKDIKAVLKGQDEVIEKTIKQIKRSSLNIYPKDKPQTFLFLGSSGVGKSKLASMIAENITDEKMIYLNLTEFKDSSSINRIIGSNIGYVGSETNREMIFDSLQTNPYQVILLDEFEKCDKSVQRLFMQAFDKGFITDNRGQIIDFSKAIVFATTNAHKTVKKQNSIGFNKTEKVDEIDDLRDYFDIELLNRFETILTFNNISKETFKTILKSIYERDVKRIKKEYHRKTKLDDTLSDKDTETLAQDFKVEFGARPAEKIIQNYIEEKFL